MKIGHSKRKIFSKQAICFHGGSTMRFRDKLARFFYGRNGMDGLNLFLFAILFVLMVISAFRAFLTVYILQIIVLIYLYFRYFSRNLAARYKENAAFMRIFRKVLGFFKRQKVKFRDRKTHVFRRCPHCRANLRLPKQKGKHTVRCPRCSKEFETKV